MARPREFDTGIALAKAMGVFGEHGYDDATLPDLLAGPVTEALASARG